MAQRIDVCELSSQNLVELERFMKSPFYEKEKSKGNEIKRIEYPYRAFAYIGWNQKKPFFKNKKVRQALSLAIDTKRLIQQNLNGQGVQISGPFFYFSSAYDASLPPYPYDPDQAKRMLAEAGWIDSDGDGIIDKEIDGKRVPFRFSLTYYVKNPVSRANVELVSTLLRQIGIDCVLNGVDLADLSASIDDKSFDAYYLAWQLTPPPEDPEQVWHSQGANVKGSSNTIAFANPEADKIIELLKYEANPEERTKLYHRFDALIYDEAPYAFLYTPKTTLVYWSWLKNVFVPKDRQDLIPGADVEQPSPIHGWKIGGRDD
jgi:peptide/nickel transport system substrate-binding protein